jgi:transketolase
MLVSNQKINPQVFDSGVEQVPIRKGFGEGLLEAAKADERIVGLCADLTESTQMHLLRQNFPERFVEIGIAEQNLASVASGMAAMGKIPFITSYAMFSPGRNWEQIRTTICYNNRPVKIAGSHAGISVGPDGGTHQAIEDMGIMRVIPGMVVISPCDAIEAKKATLALAKTNTPVYLRLAREKTPLITTNDTPFVIGKGQIYWTPVTGKAEVAIVATGALVHRALKVAKELEKEKIGVTVANISTIKPLDTQLLDRLANESGAIVTVEEHQVACGLGSAVAEHLVSHKPVPMEFVGVKDKFGQSGTPEELIQHYGMGEASIKEAVKKVLKRKS